MNWGVSFLAQPPPNLSAFLSSWHLLELLIPAHNSLESQGLVESGALCGFQSCQPSPVASVSWPRLATGPSFHCPPHSLLRSRCSAGEAQGGSSRAGRCRHPAQPAPFVPGILTSEPGLLLGASRALKLYIWTALPSVSLVSCDKRSIPSGLAAAELGVCSSRFLCQVHVFAALACVPVNVVRWQIELGLFNMKNQF